MIGTYTPADFIRLLYPDTKRGYISLLEKNGKALVPREFVPISKPEMVDKFVADNRSKDLYFGLGLLPQVPKAGRGAAEDVISIPGLWMDFDLAFGTHSATNLPTDWAQVQELISDLPEPTIVVHTGGGVHAYWLLDKPWMFMDPAKPTALSKAWQETYIHRFRERGMKVDNTSDLSRVLRLPGSLNHKGAEAKPVHVIYFTGIRYTVEELEPVAAEAVKKKAEAKARKTTVARSIITQEDARDMLQAIPKLPYDEWVTVIMALVVEFGEEAAAALGSEWHEEYPGETEDKIRTFQGKEYGYTAGTLIHYAIKHGWKPPVYQWEPIPVTYRQQLRYVDITEAAIRERVLLVKSPKGTGKTEALAQLIKQQPNLRVLIVGHRRALLKSMAYRLGTAYYMEGGKVSDTSVLQNYSKLAITIDSIKKLEGAAPYDLVIIDEAEQVLAHTTGSTLKENRAECYNLLQALITFSGKVIALDADLGRITYNYMDRLGQSPTVLLNTYQANPNTYLMYETKAGWIESLLRAVEQGEKLFIAANSKQAVKSIVKMLSSRVDPDRIYDITSDNSTDEDRQAFIVDINNQVQSYDVLIASPSIGTGVSIDARYFDKVYLYGEAGVNTATDLLQQGARVRSILSQQIHTWVNGKRSMHPTDPGKILSMAVDVAMEEPALANTTIINLETGKREIRADELSYVQLWADVEAAHNASKNDLRGSFVAAVQAEGAQVQKAVEGSAVAKAGASADLKAASRAVKDEFIEAVVEAEPIDYLRYSELKESSRLTEQERAQVYRYSITDFYGISDEEVDEAWVKADREGLRSRVVTFSLLHATVEDVQKLDLRDKEKGYLAPDRGYYVQARGLRLELLQAAGITDLTSSAPIRVGEKFGLYVWEKRYKIYSLLRLRVRRDVVGKPLMFVSALLQQLGLRLIAHKSTWEKDATGKRVKVRQYGIDPAMVRAMQQIVDRYRAARVNLDKEWVIDAPEPDVEDCNLD